MTARVSNRATPHTEPEDAQEAQNILLLPLESCWLVHFVFAKQINLPTLKLKCESPYFFRCPIQRMQVGTCGREV